jgi:hypothetical protein
MKISASRFLRPALVTLALASAASLFAGPPETSEDGLVLMKRTRADVVYKRPGATFGGYTKVALLEPQIAFQKDWQADHNQKNPRQKVTAAEMEKMIANGRRLLNEAFGKKLAKNGYELVNAAGDDVLAIRVSILDLEVTVPDPNNLTGSWNKTYSNNSGAATLVIELFDSGTQQVLARAYDRKAGSDLGFTWEARDQRTNEADASYAFGRWADLFVNGLEHVKKAEAKGK